MKTFGTWGRWAMAAALTALVAGGCKKEEAAAPEAPAEAGKPGEPVAAGETGKAGEAGKTGEIGKTGETPAAKVAADAAAGKPMLTLLEAGAEPRQQLRFAPKAGTQEPSTMTMGMDMEMNLQGQTIPVKMPPFIMKMNVDVTAVDAATGNFDYRMALSDASVGEAGPGVDPMVVSTMKDMLGKMNGLGGTATVSPRGDVVKADFQVPDNAPNEVRQVIDSFQQSMQQISVPFPEEAVGVGAKWQVTSVVEQNGMKIGMVSTFELKSFEDGGVVVSHAIRQSADEQFVEAPGMPPGSRAKLKRLSGEGAGEGRFKLDRATPQSFSSKLSLSLEMEVEAGGLKQNIGMKTDLDLKMAGQ